MQVALYVRVSTLNQQQEGTIASQVRSLKHYIHQQGWSLLPSHEYLDMGSRFCGMVLHDPRPSANGS
jgi:DNA invertase Pin-like site-specific DNA recombinase